MSTNWLERLSCGGFSLYTLAVKGLGGVERLRVCGLSAVRC